MDVIRQIPQSLDEMLRRQANKKNDAHSSLHHLDTRIARDFLSLRMMLMMEKKIDSIDYHSPP
jgi:tryptophan 2,3-dioxygenase